MELKIIVLSLVFLSCRTEEDIRESESYHQEHIPPIDVPTFKRDSVESPPSGFSDRKVALSNYERVEFGSKYLPLRAAVEKVPDLTETSQRLPLRDAVEKRPAPDEPYEVEDLSQTNFNLFYKNSNGVPQKYGYPPIYLPQPISVPYYFRHSKELPQSFPVPTPVPNYLRKEDGYQHYSVYTPMQVFQHLITDYRSAPIYRVDNIRQQLVERPAFLKNRQLNEERQFFRSGFEEDTPSQKYLEKDEKRIVCYIEGVAGYRKEPLSFTPEDLDPFACTHVIYAFASIDPHTFNMISRDDEFDIIQGGYRSVTGLKKLNPKLKVLISVGGTREDGSHRFSKMVASSNRRRDFIRSAVEMLKQFDFDGIDIHWQYPGAEELGGNSNDKEFLNLFLEELCEIFQPHGWLLSIAVPASRFRAEDGFNPKRIGEIVDFVNLQAYDFHRDRIPVADHPANLYSRPEDNELDLFFNVEYAVNFWLKKGLPKSKLVLGIPLFGRSFTLQYFNETAIGSPIIGPGNEGYYTQNPGMLAYFEICDVVLNEGWRQHRDSSGSPYIVNGDQWVGFDDPESIERKVSFVKENELGGVFVWAADLDDFRGLCGEKWPLLSAVNRHLKGAPLPLSTDEPTKPYGSCESDGLYTDPKNCAAYYICRNGFSYHLSCGDDTMFDPETGRCDYIQPQQCKPGQTIYISQAMKDLDILLKGQLLSDDTPKVVCYFTNWAFYRKAEGKFVPEHIDQRLCTHVVYAFASLDPEKLLMKEFDPWADLDNDLYDRVTSLHDVVPMISLGGWTDSAGDKYSKLVGDGSARRRFVVGAVSFLRRYGFKGLHFDWNYPICWQSNCLKGPASDKPNFTKLIQELKREFDKENPPLVLAAAISGYKEVIDVAYDLPQLSKYLDFMSVMTYDYHGAWEHKTGHVSPLYHRSGDRYPQYNTNFTMEYLVTRGAVREKLLVGIPFYGQTFSLQKPTSYDQGVPSSGPGEAGEYTKQPGMLAYYEICNRIRNKRWIVSRDPTGATGPYAYSRDQWVGFEDTQSVREKAAYIKEKGFGGAVAWTIDLDDFNNRCCGGSFPLLRSISYELGLTSESPKREDCTKPAAPVTPAPPQTTTGVDTGAHHTTEHSPDEWDETTTKTTTKKPVTWWSQKPTTTQPVTWWSSSEKPQTTMTWWSTTTSRSTTTRRTSWTTKKPKPTTTTSVPFVVSGAGTTIPPPGVIMPEVDKPTQSCQPGEYKPDLNNCNAYYRCVLGELRKQYCSGGLHWNKERNLCDWPAVAKCEKKPHYITSTTTVRTRPTTTTTTRKPITTTRRSTPYKRPSTVNHWQTKTTPWWQSTTTTARYTVATDATSQQVNEIMCTNGQYYPHEVCTNFYICVNGDLVTQSCPPGLSWNVDKFMCDWSYRVKCLGRNNFLNRFTVKQKFSADLMPQPYAPCEENTFAPYIGDCTQYLHCLWGKYEVFQCAPGLHYSLDKSICDWPDRAKCTDNTIIDTDENIEPTTRPVNRPTTYPSWKPTSSRPTKSTPKYPDWKPTTPERPQTTTKTTTRKPTTKPSSWTTTKPSHWTTTKPSHWTTSKPTSWTSKRPVTTSRPSTTTSNNWEWHPPLPADAFTEPPTLAEPLKPQSGYFKIVCYFTNWAWYRKGLGRYLPEHIDENLCTHIVYGFAVLDYTNLVIKAHDSWADYDNRFYERVTQYKEKGIKVTLAIGGWNDSQGDKYSRLVNNPAARAKFIKHVIEFLEKHNFDGLDLDWEYPKCWQVDCKKGPDSDKKAFAAWLRELKAAFRPKGLLLSAAVSPSKTVVDAGYDVPAVAENLDWVSVMTYDFHGQWDKKTGHVAPLYYHPDDDVSFFNANFSINYWISEGVPRRKIVMGMPLYGQAFQLEKESNHGLNAKAPGPGQAGEFTRAAGFLAYYEICDKIMNKGWTVVQDPKRRMGPYAYKGNQWVSFDDKEMIRLKSEYIRKMDLGGGMIWALDLDDFKNRCGHGRHPLLVTIRNVLADAGTGHPEPIPPIPEDPEETEAGEKSKFSYPPSAIPPITITSPARAETTTAKPVVDVESDYKVVCYFTNWAWYRQGVGKYLPSDIETDLCTHIVYGFAVLNSDHLIIKPHDTWADFDNKFYEKVTALKEKGIKVLIAIGGWNDSAGDKYSRLVNNPSARRRFIAHVMDFIEENNFDGLDLDWEYPKCWQVDCNKGPHSDKTEFAAFVQELHEAFKPKGWLLSSAVSPSKRVIDAGYDVSILSKYLDWIAVMCYDYHGQWDKITGHVAPMYDHPEDIDSTFNTNFTINYWIEKGADRRKLVMGMPMYGQSFSLADNNNHDLNAPTYGGGEAGEETRARGFLAYYEICQNIIKKGWKVIRDRKGRIGPYAYLRDQWVSFDDIGMIRHKSEYIKAMGLGGGMIWALDLDDFKNICGCEEYPLLRTINRVLRNYAKPAPKCILGHSEFKPTKKPFTKPPITSTTTTTTKKPVYQPPIDTEEVESSSPTSLDCNGRIFQAHDTNCNQYYLCNQGQLQVQSCPGGLYWNVDHCDWPENTQCHPDGSTLAPIPTSSSEIYEPEEVTPELVPELDHTTSSYKPGTDTAVPDSRYKVVCYFTNWAWYRQGDGKYLPEDIDPKLCTHINYGFAVLDPNSLTIKPHDSWADIDNEFFLKVASQKSRGVKVLIALGGWNDSLGNKYSKLVNDAFARTRFVENVMRFIEKWGFDGLDFDWEYPKCWQVDCNKGPDSDKEGFASLIAELSRAFKPRGWLLTAAVSPSKTVIDEGYDVPKLSKYLDFISVMTYDYHGHWDKKTGHVAPLYYYPEDTYDYFNANYTINYWIEKGTPRNKLIMGLPFYGQSFTLANEGQNGLNERSYGPGEAGEFTRAGGFLAFYEICDRVRNKGWIVNRDPEGRIGPYTHMGNQWVSYDDISEVRRKSKFIKEMGLGGGMIWALDLDDFRNRCGCGKHPLLKTLNSVLRGLSSDIKVKNCT